MKLTRKSYFRKELFYSFFFLLISIQLANAENIEMRREKAIIAYFSGELESSLPLFLSLSESGDAESQYYAGLIYLTEGWSGRNVEKAIAYLTTAADQSNAEAMWKIGEIYENGWGAKKDILVALDWYRKSKQSGIDKSRMRFMKLNKGKAVFKSNAEMIEKLIRNAEKNNTEAKFKLGNIYDEGKLTERNIDKAYLWYEKAAKNNHSYSMLMLGYFLCRGLGVEIDKVKANDWLNKSGRNAHCN